MFMGEGACVWGSLESSEQLLPPAPYWGAWQACSNPHPHLHRETEARSAGTFAPGGAKCRVWGCDLGLQLAEWFSFPRCSFLDPLFFVVVIQRGLWALSFPTRDGTHIPTVDTQGPN